MSEVPLHLAHIRQSRPDSGLVFQVKVLETFEGVASLLGSGASTRCTHKLISRGSWYKRVNFRSL